MARMRDQALELTTSEFDLLLALVQARGRVLTREVLIDAVVRSNLNHEIRDRSIDVYVRRLRSKLGDDARGHGHVLTVPGIGYRMAAPGASGLSRPDARAAPRSRRRGRRRVPPPHGA